MELDKIEELLEKYFEATTTAAEEETLKAYFSKEDVAEHLQQYAPMFQYFKVAKEEQFDKQVLLNTAGSAKDRRSPLLKWISIAAVGLLFFGIYFGNGYIEQQEKERADTEYAYQETKKALNLLSENFNRGTEKVAYLHQFEVTKQKIYNDN